MKTLRSTWLMLAAAAALTASCAHTDVGITTKIRAKMELDESVRPYTIEVAARNGVVTLTGNIDSETAKERALTLARGTAGVVEVTDMIAVRRAGGDADAPEPGRTVGVSIDDAGTTIRVKGRLLEDPLVKGLRIDVDTRAGVVYLTGRVGSDREKEQAIKLARETSGVKEVQANLTPGRG